LQIGLILRFSFFLSKDALEFAPVEFHLKVGRLEELQVRKLVVLIRYQLLLSPCELAFLLF